MNSVLNYKYIYYILPNINTHCVCIKTQEQC